MKLPVTRACEGEDGRVIGRIFKLGEKGGDEDEGAKHGCSNR